MKIRMLLAAAALSTAALLPLAAPAAAQPPAIHVGATVTDTAGATVGTITAVTGTTVTVRTDKHEVPIPVGSFATSGTQVVFGMTRDQLNAAVEQASAASQAAFAVGAQVHDRDGALVGTVAALDADTVTVQMDTQRVRLPRSALAGSANGLVTGATVAELRAATATPAPAAH